MNISFSYIKPQKYIQESKKIKSFIELITKEEGFHLKKIHFIFCDDEYLLEINQKFLQGIYYTDIIAFQFNNDNFIEAEIYVSLERVRDNAKIYKVSPQAELIRVMFHGVLHLCGYLDKKNNDKEKMKAREEFYLKKYLNNSFT